MLGCAQDRFLRLATRAVQRAIGPCADIVDDDSLPRRPLRTDPHCRAPCLLHFSFAQGRWSVQCIGGCLRTDERQRLMRMAQRALGARMRQCAAVVRAAAEASIAVRPRAVPWRKLRFVSVLDASCW